MNTLSDEEKKIIFENLKKLAQRFNVISKIKPRDKIWIIENDNNVKFEIDDNYWLKSITQPIYRYIGNQNRVRIINQIINDTKYLEEIYPLLNNKKKAVIKKIVIPNSTKLSTIDGLDIMKQNYSNYKDKINQVIEKLKNIIHQKKNYDELYEIDLKEKDEDEELEDTIKKELQK